MDKDNFIKYSPIIIVIMGFFISYNIFVTPADMADKIDNLETKIEAKYATKAEITRQQKQLDDVIIKIDKIYDYIIGKK